MKVPGKISGIHDDYAGTSHVRVNVKHGKRKRSKGADGEKGKLDDFSRPESNVMVPRGHAANFRHGQAVNLHITPAEDGQGDMDGDEGEAMQNGVAPTARAIPGRQVPSKLPPIGAKKSSAAKAKILSAMNGKKKK